MKAERDYGTFKLLYGHEIAGVLVDSAGREALRDLGYLFAYAFYPDLIALSPIPLEGTRLEEARLCAIAQINQKAPRRSWPLSWPVELR